MSTARGIHSVNCAPRAPSIGIGMEIGIRTRDVVCHILAGNWRLDRTAVINRRERESRRTLKLDEGVINTRDY